MLDFKNMTPRCDPESELCGSSTAALILDALNATSFFINLIHLIILRKLDSLRGKPYYSVLVAMCLVDMWLSISILLVNNCRLRTYVSTAAQLPSLWNLVMSTLAESGAILRYIMHCLSTVERYIAVCRPYVHRSSLFVRHIAKVLFGFSTLVTIILASTSLAQFNSICVHSILGPTKLVNVSGGVLASVLTVVPAVATPILLTFTWREILQLQRAAPQQLAGTKFAVKYVMVINILFISIMVPTSLLLMAAVMYWSKELQPPGAFFWFGFYSQALYGMINCLIYGCMSDAYRKVFVQTFLPKICCRQRVTTRPTNDEAQETTNI